MQRMQRMLDIAGHPAVGLFFDEEAHSFSKDENTHVLWKGIAGFLKQHLDAPIGKPAAQSAQ